MKTRAKMGAIILMAIGVLACSKPEPTREKIEQVIVRELPVGSSKSQIESFFKRHHMEFSYDDILGNRYQSLIRYDKFSGLLIYIYTDNQGRVVRTEVQGFSTGL